MLGLLFVFAVSAVLAQQCPGDETGCWMCPDSPLMNCLNTATNLKEQCDELALLPEVDAGQLAVCYCQAQQGQADCWSFGLYCSEWLPNQIAADELCTIANNTLTNTTVSAESLSAAQEQAEEVTSSIWNNDSGTDIPVLDNPASYPSYTSEAQSGPWSEPYEASISGSLTTPSAITVLSTSMPSSAPSPTEDILTIQTINPTAQGNDVQAVRSATMMNDPAGDGTSSAEKKAVAVLALLPFALFL